MDATYTGAAPRPGALQPLAVLVLVLAAALLGGVAPARALSLAPASDPRFTVVADGYGPESQPRFAVRMTPFAPLGAVNWRICASSCSGVVGAGQQFAPETLPVGARVLAFTILDGRMVVAFSEKWPGAPASATPPGINGDLRIGRVISSAGGAWTGGWADDFSVFEYRLCRTAAGDDCRKVRPGTGSADRVVIDPAWAGWYLGAIEHRYAPGTAFPAIAYAPPTWGALPGDAVPAAAPRTAIGPLAGPIPAARPGTLPRVSGTLAAGRTVRPRSGTWPDAPDAGTVRSGLRACPTRKDSDRCVAIHDFSRIRGAPRPAGRPDRPALNQPARLEQRYLGWYVGAVDLHVRDASGHGPADFTPPMTDVKTFPIPAPSPVVVHGPLSRPPVRLGFTPRATIRSRATTHATRHTTLATVRCKGRCVARVTVVSGGRTTRTKLVVRGSKRLTVPGRATRGRQARVTIRFDHHPQTASRTVRLA